MRLFISSFNDKQGFLIKTAAIGAVLILLYSVYVELASPAITKTSSQWGDNRLRAERLFYGAKGYHAVVVGSSLSARLPEHHLGPSIYNLAMGGDSALTGLRLLTQLDEKPAIVIVETNILHKPVDEQLLHNISTPVFRDLRKYWKALRFEYQPVNVILSIMKRNYGGTEEAKLAQFADPQQRQRMIAINQKAGSLHKATFDIDNNLASAVESIRELEKAGTKIIFLSMPISPELVNTPLYSLPIEKYRNRYAPEHYQWITGDSFASGLDTTDGLHLIYRDAAKVAQLIRASVNG